jgi:tetratricopeptide (TPR) repeat protein
MNPMTAGVILSTVALLVQGTRCLMRQGAPPFVRRFGALTLLLAGLSAVLFILVQFGEAVLSPEFDTVMARGHRRGLTALVFGLAVAASLGLHVQRLKAERPGRLGALLALGVCVGLLATMRITTLNPEADTFQVYAYDLWWPPLLVWVSVCFLDGAITMVGMRDRRIRMGFFALLLFCLSWAATRRASFTDPTSLLLWTWLFRGSVVLGLAVLVSFVLAAAGGAGGAWRWLAAAPRRAGLALAEARRRIAVEGWESELAAARAHVPLTYGGLLGLLALATIAAALIDIFYLGRFSHVTVLVVLAIAWTCLAEVTAEGPLRAFVLNTVPAAYDSLVSQQSRLGALWSGLRSWLGTPLRRVATAAGRLLSLRPLPEGILKLFVLLVIAVVLFEIPNRGKTVLLTFKSAVVKPKQDEVATVEQQAAIGQAVFDHLVNTLGVLTQDLQPDVILLLPPEPERAAQFRAISAGGAGSLDPFLSGTTELDMGLGIKIPLSLVLTPIVKPVRWLLGVRVIDGSVLADPQGYTVLVRSSSGEVWQARLRDEDRSRERPAGGSTDPPIVRLTPASAFTRLALELAFRIMSAEPTLASVGMTRSWEAFTDFRGGLLSWQRYAVQSGEQDPDALTEAIRRFRAAIGVDPTFALAHYRLGLALHKDGQPIAAAEALRTSLKANPGFVPARVALASVLYGLDSRTLSRTVAPTERSKRGVRPARDAAATAEHDELHEAMVEEARGLWQSVVEVDVNASPLDRAAAWAGLCRHALERGAVEDTVRPARDSGRGALARWIWPTGAGPRLLHAAYFYCQQADRSYTSLLAARAEDIRIRTARASVLASVGLLLEQHGPRRPRRPVDGWQCSAAAVDPTSLTLEGGPARTVPVNRFTRHALRYYRRALALLPDDPVLRCREATAALALEGSRRGGERLMRALENVATAHLILADSYRDLALRYLEDARTETPTSSATRTTPGRQVRGSAEAAPRHHPGEVAAAFFQLSLDEYREALARDPTNTAALNQFARAFWQWRLAAADGVLSREPTLAHAREAEWNARRAVSIVEAKLGRAAASLVLSDRSPDAQGKLAGVVPAHLHPPAATALGSLGAVLLAQARAHEALDVLGSAQALAPEHPMFDDVRWMLGHALLCAASREFRADFPRGSRGPGWRETITPMAAARLEDIGALRQEAAVALHRVREQERTREGRPLTGRTDVTTSLEVCRQDWLGLASEREGQIRYALREEERRRGNYLCGRLGVRVPKVPGQKEAVYLRVWGGGAERFRLEAEEDALERRSDVVSLAPTTSRFYYFVQLESEDGRPLSLPLPLDPAPGAAGATGAAPGTRCPEGRNLVRLAVGQPPVPGAAVAEHGSPGAPAAEAAEADRPDAAAPTR